MEHLSTQGSHPLLPDASTPQLRVCGTDRHVRLGASEALCMGRGSCTKSPKGPAPQEQERRMGSQEQERRMGGKEMDANVHLDLE